MKPLSTKFLDRNAVDMLKEIQEKKELTTEIEESLKTSIKNFKEEVFKSLDSHAVRSSQNKNFSKIFVWPL